MKILVTGATGTIGANLVRRLVETGHEVRSQVRPGSPYLYKIEHFQTDVWAVDVRDRDKMDDLVKGVDVIMNLTMANRENWSVEGFLDVNIGGTLFLLEAVKRSNPHLRRFIHASSTVLYPQTGFNSKLFQEKDKLSRPRGPYGVSKLAAEAFVHTYHHDFGIPAVTVTVPETFCGREILGERERYVTPYIVDHLEWLTKHGDRSEAKMECIAKLQKHLEKGTQLVIPLTPDGTSWRRHLGDVRDVVSGFMRALTASDEILGETFVIMSDSLDYGEGVKHFSKLTGLEFAEEAIPLGSTYWYDMEKTERMLGYRAEFDSRRMMEDAWRHYNGEDIGIVDGVAYSHIRRDELEKGISIESKRHL